MTNSIQLNPALTNVLLQSMADTAPAGVTVRIERGIIIFRSEITGEHRLDSSCTTVDRLNAHWQGFVDTHMESVHG